MSKFMITLLRHDDEKSFLGEGLRLSYPPAFLCVLILVTGFGRDPLFLRAPTVAACRLVVGPSARLFVPSL